MNTSYKTNKNFLTGTITLECDYCKIIKSLKSFSNKYRQTKYLDVKREELRLCKACSSSIYKNNNK